VLASALIFVAGFSALGQTAQYACAPSPPVAAAIHKVERLRVTAASDVYTDQARRIMEDIVGKYPDDIFGQLAYLRLYSEMGHEDVVARYRAAMLNHPGDPRHELLYAASLVGNDTRQSLERLTRLGELQAFPYPHLLISRIRSYPGMTDNAAVGASALRFTEACPNYLPAYEMLTYFGSGERAESAAGALRRMLDGRTDTGAAVAFRWLWQLEFRTAPVARHDDLRKQVRRDLALLREHYTAEDPDAGETFRAGYRITGQAGLLAAAPGTRDPLEEVASRWRKEHPALSNRSAEESQRYLAEVLQAANVWIARWPDEPMPHVRRLETLRQLTTASEGDLVAAGEALIAAAAKRPRRYLSMPAVLEVARVYVARGIRLGEVPQMVEAGLRQNDRTKRFPEYDFDPYNTVQNESMRYRARVAARAIQFDWAVKTAHRATLASALAAMRQDADKLEEVARRPDPFSEYTYWLKAAEFAEAEGRKEDAAGCKRKATDALRTAPQPRASPVTASAIGKRLPPFNLAGLDGRAWTPADLDGKIVVMNVWATWCAPCVAELPFVQKFHETLKDRPGAALLTLNMDSNLGAVAPFLRERGFSFPVVVAYDYVARFMPEMGIPRTWIVESGVIRGELTGPPNPGAWIQDVVAKVDELRRRE
jgi:thiol-disulfide isomerase/thioredoxin